MPQKFRAEYPPEFRRRMVELVRSGQTPINRDPPWEFCGSGIARAPGPDAVFTAGAE
jgi:hypothetical protein